ncbi:MAG: hypothetical protein ACRETX_14430, partial [Steroidobacteraceae bacterium]
LHQHALKRGETEFSIEVPAGRYWIFTRPDEPGLTELYGAHTQISLCRRAGGGEETSECADHGLAQVAVRAGSDMTRVAVDDWMLSDEAATELDRIVGLAPASIDSAELGRPRFSEYRVALGSDTAVAQPDFSSDPRTAPLAAHLQEAALAGSNFAGRFTLARVPCGERCAQVAIIDQASGTVSFPDALSQGLGTLPCRAERALDFREDSRLLEFTRREAEIVVTDYLLWDTKQRSFAPLAQYRRSLERFCAGATPAQ